MSIATWSKHIPGGWEGGGGQNTPHRAVLHILDCVWLVARGTGFPKKKHINNTYWLHVKINVFDGNKVHAPCFIDVYK